jgi:hypothetical protein
VDRFPVYTDADVHGPIVDGPEGTLDIDHSERAAGLGRVLIANDKHMKALAESLARQGNLVPRTDLAASKALRPHEQRRDSRRYRSTHDHARRLRLSHRIDRGVVMVRRGKGGKERMVPIGERALRWIEK